MSKEISKQEKEDYLSLMYEMKRKENQIVKSDLSRELEVPLSRVTRVTDGLLEEGYLLKDEGRRMFLTPMGLSKGQFATVVEWEENDVLQNFCVWFLVLMEVLQKKMHVRSNMFWMNAF